MGWRTCGRPGHLRCCRVEALRSSSTRPIYRISGSLNDARAVFWALAHATVHVNGIHEDKSLRPMSSAGVVAAAAAACPFSRPQRERCVEVGESLIEKARDVQVGVVGDRERDGHHRSDDGARQGA